MKLEGLRKQLANLIKPRENDLVRRGLIASDFMIWDAINNGGLVSERGTEAANKILNTESEPMDVVRRHFGQDTESGVSSKR